MISSSISVGCNITTILCPIGRGIVNIVMETREIGIRRSIGALGFDIVRQFPTESVLISAIIVT